MKARYSGECGLCRKPIMVGADITGCADITERRGLGQWAHHACRYNHDHPPRPRVAPKPKPERRAGPVVTVDAHGVLVLAGERS